MPFCYQQSRPKSFPQIHRSHCLINQSMDYYDDAYTLAQEHTTYFSVPYQDPVSFSSYESYIIDANYDAYNDSVFHEPKSIDHGDYGYDYDSNYDYNYKYGYNYDYDHGNWHNWYSSFDPTINYLAHNYMEPKLIAYEPVACDTGYLSYHTQYSISYSQVDSGFNEPEFEEYDPTPYGGGYDIVSTYGNPLPPSDKTCYPRSKPKPIGPRPIPNSISQPVSKPEPMPTPMSIAPPIPLIEPKPKTEPEPKPMPISPIPPVEPRVSEPEPKHVHDVVPLFDTLELKEDGEREKGENGYPGYGYDYPWPEYDYSNANRVGYDYGYGKQVVQISPNEYSPEVVDLCESIFGNWPCLARIRKQQMSVDNKPGMSGPEIGNLNPWEDCASYIFGRPIVSYNG